MDLTREDVEKMSCTYGNAFNLLQCFWEDINDIREIDDEMSLKILDLKERFIDSLVVEINDRINNK